MDFNEYKQIDAINASIIKHGRKSMLAMHHAAATVSEPTSAMEFGTLVHTMLLEPARFEKEVVVYDGTKRGKDWDSFKLANDGKSIITAKELANLDCIKCAVANNSTAMELLSGDGQNELSITWSDSRYGNAKARLDRWKDGIIIDIKTCADLSTFNLQFVRMGYDLQLGWYREGAEKALCKKCAKAVVIAIENKAPFDVAVFQVPENAMQKGREDAIRIASEYNTCKRSGVYPGVFGVALSMLEMPAWYEGPSDADLDAYGFGDPSDL